MDVEPCGMTRRVRVFVQCMRVVPQHWQGPMRAMITASHDHWL